MLFSCHHLRSPVPLTDNPHPFEIEKRCSKVDTKRDYKIQVAIRQRVLPPVRKEKEKKSSPQERIEDDLTRRSHSANR